MSRAAVLWGGAAAVVIGLGGLALGLFITTTASPEAHVQRYLEALARDDLGAAARLAGLEPPQAMPLGDEGEPSIQRIVTSVTNADGTVTVLTEYGTDTDAVRVPFRLAAAPPMLGLIPAWRFVEPPVVALSVAADAHDRVTVTDRPVVTEGAGVAEPVAVFVPARVTVRSTEPLLQAEPVTVRATRTALVTLAVSPSPRFERAVQRYVDELMIACTAQQVLQPTGCPFGARIDDRLTGPPQWSLIATPEISIDPGDVAGVWRISGTGTVRLNVSVQQLFDGTLVDRDDIIDVVVRGDAVVGADGPVLTIYAPGG